MSHNEWLWGQRKWSHKYRRVTSNAFKNTAWTQTQPEFLEPLKQELNMFIRGMRVLKMEKKGEVREKGSRR